MPETKQHEEKQSTRHWYCLRTQTKREHIAASLLSNVPTIEVFCPRISLVKKTRSGKKRFVEAMFPGYIFARFDYKEDHRRVMHSQGVTRIVEQGQKRVVPASIIRELQATLPDGIINAPDPSLDQGAEVEIVSGSLKGLNGKVLARLSSGERVQLLLDFLGREIKVETDAADIILASS